MALEYVLRLLFFIIVSERLIRKQLKGENICLSTLSHRTQSTLDNSIVSGSEVRKNIIMIRTSARGNRHEERRQKQGTTPEDVHNDLFISA